MNEARTHRLLCEGARRFGLSLEPFTVLTEAASGQFVVTPLLAALGGCRKVYALTRDSRYATASSVAAETFRLADKWGLADRIEILSSRADPRVREADIVTNLGFVRPIDADLIDGLKPTVVIPLMWETWEFRPQDLDLGRCRERGIPVLGTNEHHPDLRIFGYIGHVVLKLLFDLEVEVFQSRVVIVGSGEFGTQAHATLVAAGAVADLLSPGELAVERAHETIAAADAIVVLEHNDRRELIGKDGLIAPELIRRLNPGIVVAHVCGRVSSRDLDAAGLFHLPRVLAPAGYMSVSTAELGPRPVIDLHAAGLSVGQALAQAAARGLGGIAAEEWALRHCDYAQGFEDRH